MMTKEQVRHCRAYVQKTAGQPIHRIQMYGNSLCAFQLSDQRM